MLLYRLVPPQSVTSCDVPRAVWRSPQVDLDGAEWRVPQDRAWSDNLLRLALKYGYATKAGIVFEAMHTAHLGRADTIKLSSYDTQEAQDQMRAGAAELDHLIPGWREDAEANDRKRAESREKLERQAEEDLARKLAVPSQPGLIEHWARLGGRPPVEF